MCHREGVPEETLDSIAPFYLEVGDVTRVKGIDTKLGTTLTIVERNIHDEFILDRM